jgi:hypothetical protein
MKEEPVTRPGEHVRESINKLGGIAAWMAAVLTLGEVILFTLYPQPETVAGWFELFQANQIIGLLEFWGLEIPMYLLFALVFLALYFALRKVNESAMVIALALALLGIGIFLATNNPFAMLSLSKQYAAAATEEQQAALQAAGETLLINTNQRAVGGFNMGLFLVSAAGLSVSAVMLQGGDFSKTTAYAGIAAFALSLADYLRQALTDSAVVALLVILPNVLFLVIWLIAVGRRLLQLGGLKEDKGLLSS